jgi:hypothetical protein
VNTTDTLTVKSSTTFTYTPMQYNYCNNKVTTFNTDGVVVCQMN